MAIDFYSSIDLHKCELQNAALQNLPSPPSTPVEGQVYYDTGDDQIKLYANSAWVALASGSISSAADDITTGDGAVSIATSSGNVTIDSQDAELILDGHTGITLQNASGDILIDSAADIVLDAAGNDFSFKSADTEFLRVTNSTGDAIIKPIVDAKDIIFQQRDGDEVARIEDNGTFNVVADKLAINGTAITSTAAELNILAGVTSTAAELNILAGVNTSAAELNYVEGVTSNIQDQLDDKAPLASPTFTGTVGGITSAMVGLGSVNNTSDAGKPISTATQTALDDKAPLASPTFTGTVTIPNLIVNGTTTNINSTNLVVEDKNIVLGDVATPSDTTADGGGITLMGLTNKTFNWVDLTDSWTSSEHVNLASGKLLKIAGTTVLTHNTLGSGVVNSSLTSVGTLANLTVTAAITGSVTGSSGSTTGNAATVTTNANLTGHITSSGNAAVLGSFTSAQLKAALTDETGSGAAVFATSPTLVTPALGTPVSGDLSGCTVASAIAKGVVELATAEEVIAGIETAVVITPDTLAAKSVSATIDVSSLIDSLSVTITHNLGTRDVIVQMYGDDSHQTVYADVFRTTDDLSSGSENDITIDFSRAPLEDIRVLITSIEGATTAPTIAYT
jgi:hypothetical protein